MKEDFNFVSDFYVLKSLAYVAEKELLSANGKDTSSFEHTLNLLFALNEKFEEVEKYID